MLIDIIFISIIIMDTIRKPKIVLKDSQQFIKVDMGDHYYEGVLDKSLFPTTLPDHISIVEKSLVNYSTPVMSITGEFMIGPNLERIPNDQVTGLLTGSTTGSATGSATGSTKLVFQTAKYNITVKVTQEFLKFEQIITINMNKIQKEQYDYINERFAELETSVSFLKAENENLRAQIKEILDEREQTESDDESIDERVKAVIKAPEPEPAPVKARRVRTTL
jgi:hypothetical protein